MTEDKVYPLVKDLILEYLEVVDHWNGFIRFDLHKAICVAYIEAYIGEETIAKLESLDVILYVVKKNSTKLTNNLDEIGYLIGEEQDLSKLVYKFYGKFRALVDHAIDRKVGMYLRKLEQV